MAPIIWLILGLVLVGAEMLSGDFVLVMLGVGALGAAGAALATSSVVIPAVVFAVVAVGLIVGARPALKRRFYSTQLQPTNTDALVGRRATAVTQITHENGRVKIGGDVWSARSLHEDNLIEEGSTVTVVEIAGATAVVTND
jgi:membrane protein implicated in regulation of membrane protease activity